MFHSARPWKGQNYNKIKKQCLSTGKLFVDPLFQPTGRSLCFGKAPPDNIVWKRPGELSTNPQLFVDGADPSDFKQGELGNCWFVAACACIAGTPKLWKKIVPGYEKQEWTEDNKYAGIFHFQFYRGGEWIDVVIDDFLPTRRGRLIYTSSNDKNEFWSALLEKAYAKLFGDYESLESGHCNEALVDMLGGVGQSIDLSDHKSEEKKNKLFEILLDAYENQSQMAASISTNGNKREAELSNGLVVGHAYSVTGVRRIRQGTGIIAFFKKEKLEMIRLRNPWGKTEWKGAWSDDSPEWKNVSEKEKKAAGLLTDDNGEFWMSFHDFMANYTEVEICHMINTSFLSIKKSWQKCEAIGRWVRPHRAGGCGNHDTFLLNPQYIFDVKDEKEDIIISLEQEDQRMHKEEGKRNASIGVAIHKTDLNREFRMKDRFIRIDTSSYGNSRNIFYRETMPKGRYLIIPSTFDPNFEATFWLRIYGGTNVQLKELKEEGPKDGFCRPKYRAATHITILNATDLQKMEKGGADPYCIVKSEGREYRTPFCRNTLNPEWNMRVVLYRKSFSSDITVEVWNYNILKDDFMGQVVLQGEQESGRKDGTFGLPLTGRKKEANQQKPGELALELKHFDDVEDA